MRLIKARVQKYRSIRDTGWFDVETNKTILVGPNEAGKTAILRALQQLNAPKDVEGFDSLRDYPRSELNDIDSGKVKPEELVIVEGDFVLEEDDQEAVPQAFRDCTYRVSRRLDNKPRRSLRGGPKTTTYADIEKDLSRLIAHADLRAKDATDTETPVPLPSEEFQKIAGEWKAHFEINKDRAQQLQGWMKKTLPYVDEDNEKEEQRYNRLNGLIEIEIQRSEVLSLLWGRLPVFVLYSNFFRVKPQIHLEHLAERIETNILDDDTYDYGNKCLLQLLGFKARELSDLGKAAAPNAADRDALKRYRDQLNKRKYQLNAASVRLTEHIRDVWKPDLSKDEADRLRIDVDGQYLKVVVEDELGVEIELDQRSEGFQWLISFFVVFFAESAEKHENAVLLLDEPGLSLHGLKQREFRDTISKLAKVNQTVYTTHSPFLVGPDELDLVRVVEMPSRKDGTTVHTKVTATDPAALLPLQEALGYDLAQSLFSQKRNLVLEGLTDYWYLDATAAMLREAGEANLNETIALVPANTAGKVVYFATILHAQKLRVAALLDSDAAGDQAAQQELLVHTLGNKAIFRTKDYYSGPVATPEIEDMLRSTLVDVASQQLGWDISEAAEANPTRPIVDVFTKNIKEFSKYKLAKAYLRWIRESEGCSLSSTENAGWVRLIEKINLVLK